MSNDSTHGVTFDAGKLTDAQKNGLACVVCSVSYLTSSAPSVPVGTVDGGQVFACESHTAAAGKSSTWPSGEPDSVREAEQAPSGERFTWQLIGDVFAVLEAHGYRRGDNRSVGAAVGQLMDLVETYERTGA